MIIVGTHLDLLKDTAKYPEDYEEAMASLVRKMFLMNKEPDKCGLPNILDTIHVSCKNGKNISDLVKLIAYHAFEMKHPRKRLLVFFYIYRSSQMGLKIPVKLHNHSHVSG